ncbi:kinase-like protein [Whalleya microplaca]|nr:kinase-like protein [Whalleya microplaca]
MKMDPDEELSRAHDQSTSDVSTEEGDVQSISRSGTKSVSISDSRGSTDTRQGIEEHRNMMLASLLEDYYRTRAAEFLNTAQPGKNYTRQSKEVQPLARRLFNQASQTLSSNGLISSVATSDDVQSSRIQYLSGLDNLGASSRESMTSVLGPMQELVAQSSRLSLASHPANDLQLSIQPPQIPSHYQSSFRELALLGKGGFGKVYQCYNPLDQKTYAVKKIPLSPRLGKRMYDGRHEELQHVLREVKALAELDHPNIVRYHATWFEEPHQIPQAIGRHNKSTKAYIGPRQRLLLNSHAFPEDPEILAEPSVSAGIVFEEDTKSMGGDIVFGEDTPSFNDANKDTKLVSGHGWSEQPTSQHSTMETQSLSTTSDIFTDGKSRSHNISPGQAVFDANGYVLYIQMSMYPMTLAQYISPISNNKAAPRHCFHLLPTLHLLLAILAGLQYIHSKGFIHRDIKPGNIFLSTPEAVFYGGYCDLSCTSCPESANAMSTRWLNPRIGDFGLVAELARGEMPMPLSRFSAADSSDGSATDKHKPVGTAYYRPPDPKGKDAHDEKIDIFALGIVFVEMMCACGTAMERVDMLKGLQKGRVPASLGEGVKGEGYDAGVVHDVVGLARGMVEPDSRARWSGSRVDEVIKDILRRCGK